MADLGKVERLLENTSSAKRIDIAGEMLRHRIPLHFGGMSDPFATPEVSQRSRELLRLFSEHNYPIVLSTKNSIELIEQSTLDILATTNRLAVQITITSLDEEVSSIIEPNAPTPSERLSAIKILADSGHFVAVRLQPLFLTLIDHCCEELIPVVADCGANHVIVEMMKLPVEVNSPVIRHLYSRTDWNDYDAYRNLGATLVGREWVLPSSIRWDLLQPVIKAIRNSGMTYGAADLGLCHLGDTDCCCGIDGLEGFDNWFQGNFSNLIRQAPAGNLSIEALKASWIPVRSIRTYINSNSRHPNVTNMRDALKQKWNSPGSANAPDQFLGVTWKGDYDYEGNCVYIKA